MLLYRILSISIKCFTLVKINLSTPITVVGERPISWYFPFYPILNFANYTKSPLFIRIRLIGSNALFKISANILIVIGGDRRCLPLLINSLI